MDGRENDADGVIGLAEALFSKEEWEEAVRVLERAFEASGRQDREVRTLLLGEVRDVDPRDRLRSTNAW